MKTFLKTSIKLFALAGWLSLSNAWADKKAVEDAAQQLFNKIGEYRDIVQFSGDVLATADALSYISQAAQQEGSNYNYDDYWYHDFRIRRFASEGAINRLKNRIPNILDQAIRTIIQSSIDTLLNEGNQPKTGNGNYWWEQLTRYRGVANQTMNTLKQANNLIVQKADAMRDDMVKLMKKVLENPEGLPETVKSLYEQQLKAFNEVDEKYQKRKAELDLEYEKRREQLEKGFQENKGKREAEENERRNKLDQEFNAKKIEVEKNHSEAVTKLATALEAKKKETDAAIAKHQADLDAAVSNLNKVRTETTKYINDAAAVQTRIEAAARAIQEVAAKLRNPRERGTITVETPTKTNGGHFSAKVDAILRKMVDKLIAGIRDYSDIQMWDEIKPTIQASITIQAEYKKDTYRGKALITLKLGLDQGTTQMQTITIENIAVSEDRDDTPLAEIRSAALEAAPEAMAILRANVNEDWRATTQRALDQCEAALAQINVNVPKNPNVQK